MKRYKITGWYEDADGCEVEHPEGGWVPVEDALALKARVVELELRLNAAQYLADELQNLNDLGGPVAAGESLQQIVEGALVATDNGLQPRAVEGEQ